MPVMSDIQTKIGMRKASCPGARSLTTVTTRLTPVAIVPTPVTSRPSAQ